MDIKSSLQNLKCVLKNPKNSNFLPTVPCSFFKPEGKLWEIYMVIQNSLCKIYRDI